MTDYQTRCDLFVNVIKLIVGYVMYNVLCKYTYRCGREIILYIILCYTYSMYTALCVPWTGGATTGPFRHYWMRQTSLAREECIYMYRPGSVAELVECMIPRRKVRSLVLG